MEDILAIVVGTRGAKWAVVHAKTRLQHMLNLQEGPNNIESVTDSVLKISQCFFNPATHTNKFLSIMLLLEIPDISGSEYKDKSSCIFKLSCCDCGFNDMK